MFVYMDQIKAYNFIYYSDIKHTICLFNIVLIFPSVDYLIIN